MALANKCFFGVLGFLSVLLLIQKGHAFEFKVGGSQGWTVPTDTNAPIYNQWAEKSRFQIGDTLLFVYPADQDSVLQVSKDDYTNCNTESPIQKLTDGHTVYKLNQSGPHYFISGVVDHCHKNEKLIVVVMADRTHQSSSPPSPPPSEEVPPRLRLLLVKGLRPRLRTLLLPLHLPRLHPMSRLIPKMVLLPWS